jgi:hypothetical protein
VYFFHPAFPWRLSRACLGKSSCSLAEAQQLNLLFLSAGETAGSLIESTVGIAEKLASETADIVGQGMDAVGLEDLRKELIHDDEGEEERQRRREEALAGGGGAMRSSPGKQKPGVQMNPMSESLMGGGEGDGDDSGRASMRSDGGLD